MRKKGGKQSYVNDSKLLPLLIDTEKKLAMMEDLLNTSEEERHNLVARLSSVGGGSIRGVVNNCMNKLISKEMAIKYCRGPKSSVY